MIRVLNTPFGQFLAKMDSKSNTTTLYETDKLSQVAIVQTTDKTELNKAVRRMFSYLRIQKKLAQSKVNGSFAGIALTQPDLIREDAATVEVPKTIRRSKVAF